ncbi:carboxypeptidase B [Strongylocentrotus purpuratus]|uniref:Peptidase M14 domain-containing protein n=1 Tax=Strongylocentrotus purpuratus TaxID=7668 RepID=A0A7M7T1X0_STRPU|nr:carboxypeptidase B [Strongylocentrotus purpuratus]
MRGLFIVLVCIVSAFAAKDYSGYQVLRVTPGTDEHRQWLRELETSMADEIDFWSDIKNIPGSTVDIMVPKRLRATFLDIFAVKKMQVSIMIDDVGQLIHEQDEERKERRATTQDLTSFDYTVYHPYDEIQQWVTDIVDAYPTIATRFELPRTSYEGRTISGIQIKGTGGSSGMRKGVYFEGGIHAREWVSPATVMYITKELLQDFMDGDATAVRFFDTLDWYIVPSLNADGYVYTWTDDRMWRKTRSSNEDHALSGCTGTDPNRNWPFGWAGSGTSPFPCSNVYHGEYALSESEVEAVVDFLREKKDNGQDFVWFIDWHSYSQLVISPWSYSATVPDPDNLDDLQAAGEAMAAGIASHTSGTVYEVGPTAKLLYEAAGASNDWGYAPYDTFDKTEGGLGAPYSYVVELRDTGEYGFILPDTQIEDSGKESVLGVYAMGTYILDAEGL